MDQEFIRTLLYRAESVDLDFKREQYKLSGSDAEKSELVKDVLAMANAWRESTGYILLGVAESKGDLPMVVGITDFHDDAHFQQMVNSKVHPKIEFAYQVCKFDDLFVGVISVPKQKRPFYLQKRFGNIDADLVYLRRGSSTAVAKPDEIARMGTSEIERRPVPKVELSLRNPTGEDVRSREQAVKVVGFGNIDALPDYTVDRSIQFPMDIYNPGSINRSFWRDAARFVRDKAGACMISIQVHNNSSFALTHCKIELAFDDERGEQLELREERDMAAKPKHGFNIPSIYSKHQQPDVLVSDAKLGRLKSRFTFEKLLAGDTITSSDAVVLYPQESGEVTVNGRLYAHELEEPIPLSAKLNFVVAHQTLRLEDLKRMFEK